MSNHLISTAYKRDLKSAMRKAVMVLLADKASDDGRGIYASKQTMADELCTSKQTVITVIKELQKDGLLKAVGKNKITAGYTVEYAICVGKLEALPLVKCHADRQSRGLTSQAALPVKPVDQTSQATLPDQSSSFTQTLQEPSINLVAKATIRAKPFQKPDGVEQIVWDDFVALRKAKRAPVSDTVLTIIEREAAKAGWSINDALAETVARGWKSFKADWILNNGNTGRTSNNSSGNGRTNGFAKALQQVADGPFDEPFGFDSRRM